MHIAGCVNGIFVIITFKSAFFHFKFCAWKTVDTFKVEKKEITEAQHSVNHSVYILFCRKLIGDRTSCRCSVHHCFFFEWKKEKKRERVDAKFNKFNENERNINDNKLIYTLCIACTWCLQSWFSKVCVREGERERESSYT